MWLSGGSRCWGCSPVNCRACKGNDLVEGLNLGSLAISDFAAGAHAFEHAPLTLLLCQDCGLVQLSETVSRETLYEHYHYKSGIQESMVESLREVVIGAMVHSGHSEGYWLDIGANDGTLLKMVPASFGKLAYEPATNLWPELQRNGGRIVGTYFPNTLANANIGIDPKPKIITSIACFYSVDDPDAFVRGVKANLADDGLWVNQMSYWPQTMAANNFGDICHEHVTYWSLYAFSELLAKHGLYIEHVHFNDVNGGSFRAYIKHDMPGVVRRKEGDKPTLIQLKRFRQRIDLQRSGIRSLLHDLKRSGKEVIGYGASTKGNTYLQYWGITPELVAYIADRNPAKIDTKVPTGQVIVDEDFMRENYEYALVLPYHFIDSFIERERAWLEQGGKFIVPLPQLGIIDKTDERVHKARTAAAAG